MLIKRTIQNRIEKKLFAGKAIIVYGARQVGKTTLIKQIEGKHKKESIYLNCDEPDIRDSLTDVTSSELKVLIGGKKLIFLDEAQRVKNIGLTIKLLVDNFSNIQIIATGSSSFDLSNEIVEPLTGRKYEFYLYPFSLAEIEQIYSKREINRILDTRIIYGMYPDIVLKQDEAEEIIKDLRKSYLFQDLLQYQQIKNPEILEKLLQALALQIGSEVSYNELASLVRINKDTVSSYIQLLEKGFIIFRLRPFSRNLRKELAKKRKIYFYDMGIRNALINNLNPLDLRQDVGNLWENFVIAERAKFNSNHSRSINNYFWRTYQQQEIDYLEEVDGKLSGYEIKWQKKKWHKPKAFIEAYPKADLSLINKDNYGNFLGLKQGR
jgi:hypothetical protein